MKKFTKKTTMTQAVSYADYRKMVELSHKSVDALYEGYCDLFLHDYSYARDFLSYSWLWKFDFREMCDYHYQQLVDKRYNFYGTIPTMANAIQIVVQDYSSKVDCSNLSFFIDPDTNNLSLSHLSANALSLAIMSWGITPYHGSYTNTYVAHIVGNNPRKAEVSIQNPIVRYRLKFGRVAQSFMDTYNLTSAHMSDYPSCTSGQVRKITAPIL